MQHIAYRSRKLHAIAEGFCPFKQETGQHSADKNRDADGRDAQKELSEIPASRFRNNQVLWLPDHRHHTAQRSPHTCMHHQAAQECAELFQNVTLADVELAVILKIVIAAGRRNAVVNAVKPDRDANHHSHYGQGIKERGEKRSSQAEREREHRFGANTQQQAGKNEEQ
ncbi:hypothetical protein D3C78_836530 [compost metagenome]